jgi:hypothetical protein
MFSVVGNSFLMCAVEKTMTLEEGLGKLAIAKRRAAGENLGGAPFECPWTVSFTVR